MAAIFEFFYAQHQPPLRLVARVLPLVPELRLYLFPDELPQEKLAQDDFYKLLAEPPYWAFCWGGGQALARCLLDQPHWVSGRRVWDFGAGSGVAGIAALRAGAVQAFAVDTDRLALDACVRNAQLNQFTSLSIRCSCEPSAGDVVLAADICYEEAGLSQVREWARNGVSVLVAESRLDERRLGLSGLELLAQQQVRTFPDLDEAEQFDQVSIYRVNA